MAGFMTAIAPQEWSRSHLHAWQPFVPSPLRSDATQNVEEMCRGLCENKTWKCWRMAVFHYVHTRFERWKGGMLEDKDGERAKSHHTKRGSIVIWRTVRMNRQQGHKRFVLSGPNSQPEELRATDLLFLTYVRFLAGAQRNKTHLTWENRQFEFSRGLKVWREFEHEVVLVSLSAGTADRVHPGIAGAAWPSANEMDCLSCFCPHWKDACWGNGNHERKCTFSIIPCCLTHSGTAAVLPRGFMERPKQREHTSLPLHGTAGSSDWVQTKTGTRDNRNYTERVGRKK